MTERLGPVRVRVRRGQPLHPGRAGGRRPHPRRAPCCTPATSRWTSCRWTGGSPTCARSPGSARPGRRPVHGRLDQRRGARVHDLRAGDHPGAGPGVRRRRAPDHRRVVRLARAPGAAGAGRRGSRTAGGWPWSAARWCATWASPRSWATCSVPAGVAGGREGGGRPAGRPGRADVHRLAGRADGGAVPDGQPRPPGPGRSAGHRGARVVADPRQRERRVPGDQRPDPAGRQGGAPGQRPGARLRARQRRRAAVLLQHRQAAQRACRCTARCGTWSPTPSSPC